MIYYFLDDKLPYIFSDSGDYLNCVFLGRWVFPLLIHCQLPCLFLFLSLSVSSHHASVSLVWEEVVTLSVYKTKLHIIFWLSLIFDGGKSSHASFCWHTADKDEGNFLLYLAFIPPLKNILSFYLTNLAFSQLIFCIVQCFPIAIKFLALFLSDRGLLEQMHSCQFPHQLVL